MVYCFSIGSVGMALPNGHLGKLCRLLQELMEPLPCENTYTEGGGGGVVVEVKSFYSTCCLEQQEL